MQFEYTNALRHQPRLHSLAQNCELEIREVFNDLVSVRIIYDAAESGQVRARLSDVGKTTDLLFSTDELENEHRTAIKLKQAWSALFQPAALDEGSGI